MMQAAILGILLAQAEGVTPRYGEARGSDRIFTEQAVTLKLEGTDEALTFVRSLHPFLSMEKLVIRAEGTRKTTILKTQNWSYDEARVELRYDDEDYEYDYAKGQPAESDEDKIKQLMWFMAVAGRNYKLTPEGEYTSLQKDQDHNQEAMDLVALAVTRMPEGAVKEGDTWQKKFMGKRAEKDKGGKFSFTQSVKVEKIEERNGRKVAVLTSVIKGELVGGKKDPNAEEAWTKCDGVTKTEIEIGSGRILLSEGKGKVVAYYKGPASDGGTNTLTMTFGVAARTTVETPTE